MFELIEKIDICIIMIFTRFCCAEQRVEKYRTTGELPNFSFEFLAVGVARVSLQPSEFYHFNIIGCRTQRKVFA